MFRRLLLIESFEFVASPDEWQTFQSFGEVSDVDRWIQALAESPGRDCASGKLDHYERLRSMFLTRVQERLRSGEWICQAFDPTHGPELRLIPEQLWRLLEFVGRTCSTRRRPHWRTIASPRTY